MRIPVVVDCRSRGILRYHFRLRRFGLDRGEGKKYRGLVTERKLERLKELSGGLGVCEGCFTGKYPLDPPDEDIRGEFEQ